MSPRDQDQSVARRQFLRWCGLGVGACAFGELAAAQSALIPTSAPAAPRETPIDHTHPVWLGHERFRARVADIASDRVMSGGVPDSNVLEELLGRGIQAITGESSPTRGWRQLLGDAKQIAIRFEPAAAERLNTTDAVARVVVQQLSDAEYHPRGLLLVNAPPLLVKGLGAAPAHAGWTDHINVGDEPTQLAAWLTQADAVIHIPNLMVNPICGFFCGIAGLALDAVRHPAKFYARERLADLVTLFRHTALASRLRLTVVDSLQVIVDEGPDAPNHLIVPAGRLLIGCDPLAVDVEALATLQRAQVAANRPTVDHPIYLERAKRLPVGRWQANEIEVVRLTDRSS